MIPYSRQHVDQDDIDAVVSVLRSRLITTGPVVPEFEKSLAAYVGAKYAVGGSSATAMLHVACLALDLGPGDTLWTTPLSFVASANCGLYCGASVDFVDIDPETFNMDPLLIEKAITERTKVIMPVHIAGNPADMDRINDIAKKYNITVIEDAAQAHGAEWGGVKVGALATGGIFSFQSSKNMTSGEGGAIISNDDTFMNSCFAYYNLSLIHI